MDNKGNFEIEKVKKDHRNFHSPNISSDWRFGGIGLVSTGNTMESSSCSSASLCRPIWDHPLNLPNMALSDMINQNNAFTSIPIGMRKDGLGHFRAGNERTIDMGMFCPQSLSQFPADSGFIERAARFSFFGGGNFGDLMNSFGFPPIAKEGFPGNELKSISQKNEPNMAEDAKDVSLSGEHESFARSNDQAKLGTKKSCDETDEAEFSGGGQEEPSSTKGLYSKKRKRSTQDADLDRVKGARQRPSEATNDDTEIQQKKDLKVFPKSHKPSGNHGKHGSQASDALKKEYTHMRARRGQATNSHSLAERVRREKISERMKFLQDLVPGCSKVTGKAVMLDEIIDYVQSLQRQVEFLSMKLATVNPRLDVNIDGFLAKDIFQSRSGPPSTMGFSPDMPMPFHLPHSSQPGLIQTSLNGMVNSSEGIQRTSSSQLTAMCGGLKDSKIPQAPNSWEDEINNVVQMGFNSSAPLNSQDFSGSWPQGHMKVEL